MNLSKHKTFIVFILVGILNTLFGYGLFSLLLYLGLHYTIAVLIATCLGIVFNFNTIGKFVFNNDDKKLFIYFVTVYAVLYFINVGLIKLFNIFEPNLYICGFVATCIVAVLSYGLNKKFVFVSVSQ